MGDQRRYGLAEDWAALSWCGRGGQAIPPAWIVDVFQKRDGRTGPSHLELK